MAIVSLLSLATLRAKKLPRAPKQSSAGRNGSSVVPKGLDLETEPARTSWGVLPLRETIDAVIQQNHIQVDIASHGMDEVVTTDGKSVTIARNLPMVRLGLVTFAPVEIAAARP